MIDPDAPALYNPPKPTIVDVKPRCRTCHGLLAEFVGRPWRFKCRKCKAITQSDGAEEFARSTVAGAGSVA